MALSAEYSAGPPPHLGTLDSSFVRTTSFGSTESSLSPKKVATPDSEEERESLRNIMTALDLPTDWEEDELLDLLRSNGFGWGAANKRRLERINFYSERI